MHTLPVTYPKGPVALMHALMPAPYHPGPFQPQPGPFQSPPPGPCGPWGFCGNGVPGVTGEFGAALATPSAPTPKTLKPNAPTMVAAEIVLFKFTAHPRATTHDRARF